MAESSETRGKYGVRPGSRTRDSLMKDQTGIIFLDYRQPLAIWEILFGLFKAKKYQGEQVVAEGWYRRSPVPHVQLKSIKLASGGALRKSWVPTLSRVSALFLITIGVLLVAFPGLVGWFSDHCTVYFVGANCN